MTRESSVPFIAIRAGAAPFLLAAALLTQQAPADPGTAVSFSWFTSGTTDASASASCPCPGGRVFSDCSSFPYTPGFFESGSELVLTQLLLNAARSCGTQCSYSIGGASGGTGLVNSQPVIGGTDSSADRTVWSFRCDLTANSQAQGTDIECQSGSATGDALGAHEFELVFDVNTASKLRFSHQHSVSMGASGLGAASSALSLTDAGGVVIYASSLPGAGGQLSDVGVTTLVVTPGRYSLRAEGLVNAQTVAGPGDAWTGSGTSGMACTVELQTYECVRITNDPDDTTAAPGGQATFTVTASGDSPTYAWRRDGVPLTDGFTGTGSFILGSATTNLVVAGVGPADAGAYDCVVTNECGSVASAAAILTIDCPADLNGDGLVDFADYLEFLNLFDAGDLRVDFNHDGLVDFSDYLEFLNLYDAGC